MNQRDMVPEYILADMERTVLTGNQLACLNQSLLDLEVDSVVLCRELTRLVNISEEIRGTSRKCRQQLQEHI